MKTHFFFKMRKNSIASFYQNLGQQQTTKIQKTKQTFSEEKKMHQKIDLQTV